MQEKPVDKLKTDKKNCPKLASAAGDSGQAVAQLAETLLTGTGAWRTSPEAASNGLVTIRHAWELTNTLLFSIMCRNTAIYAARRPALFLRR